MRKKHTFTLYSLHSTDDNYAASKLACSGFFNATPKGQGIHLFISEIGLFIANLHLRYWIQDQALKMLFF